VFARKSAETIDSLPKALRIAKNHAKQERHSVVVMKFQRANRVWYRIFDSVAEARKNRHKGDVIQCIGLYRFHDLQWLPVQDHFAERIKELSFKSPVLTEHFL
jgi:ribosomal protein S16